MIDSHFIETAPGRLWSVFPQVIEDIDDDRFVPPGAPLIIQEYVEHDQEFRVYYVAGSLVGYQVQKKNAASLWLDESSVEINASPVPEAIANAVMRLANEWNLKYCSFDFLLSGQSAIFLEANLDGDWRWFESKAGDKMPVSAAVLKMISELYYEYLATAS